ncbi:MAG: class I SAM-dependent rRNA methyltransferase [Gammaproteobacteria bacterium]
MSVPALSMETGLPALRLKSHEERRLRAGHLWVFSNEVDVVQTPLTDFSPGQAVELQAHNGKPLGTGYVNPHSLICARLVSRDAHHPLDRSLLVHRLKVALSLRERLYPSPHYRLVHGEADGLPGLVVDRYGQILVAQFSTAGIERMREDVVTALCKVLAPQGILLRNDSPIRALEGLESYVEVAHGAVPDAVILEENGCRFRVPLQEGQKTGWYYDQRDNRRRAVEYVAGRRVLDLFSYLGGWGIQAAVHGAEHVRCVEASSKASDQIAENAALNGVVDRVETVPGDVFDTLKALREERERFDVVVVDPPAFIKRKRDLKAGLEAYHRLNRMAMQVLAQDGILVSCSCSYHMGRDELRDVLLQSARHLDRSLQVLAQGSQSSDHPVHPAIPETGYLKALFARVLPAGF